MRPTIYPETIDMIVAEYTLSENAREADADWWRADGQPFSEVIERVGNAADAQGKRHSHQWRLKTSALAEGKAALHRISNRLQQVPALLASRFVLSNRQDFEAERAFAQTIGTNIYAPPRP